jgi:hypothetical protein
MKLIALILAATLLATASPLTIKADWYDTSKRPDLWQR